MQIPQDAYHPPQPSAMVVSDTQTAKIFLINDDKIKLQKEIAFPEEWMTDSEGGFGQYGKRGQLQSFGNPPILPDDEHYIREHLGPKINDELMKMQQNKIFEKWFLIAPEYAIKSLEEKLHSYLKKDLQKKVSANLVNENPLEIIERLK